MSYPLFRLHEFQNDVRLAAHYRRCAPRRKGKETE